jgi:hypothetical protein
MQKRHYETIAKIIRDLPIAQDGLTKGLIVERFAQALKETNPRFNPERFIQACEER